MKETGKELEITSEDDNKVAYKPNREQRRKMAKLGKKANKTKVKSDINKSKMLSLIAGIKEKAVIIKKENNINKMFFCINAEDIKDTLVINYDGSETLKDSLGIITNITLDNGVTRQGNIVIYAEVTDDNIVNIEDGRGIYMQENT